MSIKSVTLTFNGQTHTLALTDGTYKKTITAPDTSSWNQTDHVYQMVLEVADTAGNVTTIDKNHATYGEQMKLRVKETTAPAIVVTSPGEGAYITNTTVSVSIDVTDTGSGVNSGTITGKMDNATITLTKTAITNGYRCTYSGTVKDGKHTLVVNASDNDGNAAKAKSVSFTVDTVPLTLNISSPPAELITNVQDCAVTGTTNDATSGLAFVQITLNGKDQGSVTVSADGTFTKSVTLAKGTNTIVIKATDKAGKYSSVTRTVIYDPDAPVIVSVDVTPNPVNAGEEITITVQATD